MPITGVDENQETDLSHLIAFYNVTDHDDVVDVNTDMQRLQVNRLMDRLCI